MSFLCCVALCSVATCLCLRVVRCWRTDLHWDLVRTVTTSTSPGCPPRGHPAAMSSTAPMTLSCKKRARTGHLLLGLSDGFKKTNRRVRLCLLLPSDCRQRTRNFSHFCFEGDWDVCVSLALEGVGKCIAQLFIVTQLMECSRKRL